MTACLAQNTFANLLVLISHPFLQNVLYIRVLKFSRPQVWVSLPCLFAIRVKLRIPCEVFKFLVWI